MKKLKTLKDLKNIEHTGFIIDAPIYDKHTNTINVKLKGINPKCSSFSSKVKSSIIPLNNS